MRLRQVGLVIGALALVAAMATPVSAAMILRIENVTTGVGAVIVDGGVGDSNSATGAITFIGSLGGGFVVNVTTGLSKPVLSGSPPGSAAEIDLNSVNVNTVGAGVVQITLADTDFSFPSSLIRMIVGGTLVAPAGSTAVFQSWANLANAVPALGATTGIVGALAAIGAIPGGSTPACPSGALSFGPGAFSGTCVNAYAGDAGYSLFSQATISFLGGGSVSFDQDTQAAVPEPGSMLLLGTGLLGLAAAARRRMRRA